MRSRRSQRSPIRRNWTYFGVSQMERLDGSASRPGVLCRNANQVPVTAINSLRVHYDHYLVLCDSLLCGVEI